MYYHDDRLSPEQIRAYLARIHFTLPPKADVITLDALIQAHQLAVPFENLDIFYGCQPPATELSALYDKIVLRRRGGWCFELNALFLILLRSLNFDARPCVCRVVKDQDGPAWPVMHRATLVCIDSITYLADVGFGGPMPAGALPLTEGGVAEIGGQTYRTLLTPEGWWELQRRTRPVTDLYDNGGEPRLRTELFLLPAFLDEADFLPLNSYFASDPGSRFRKLQIVNLRRETGHYSILGDTFTVYENGQKTVFPIDTPETLELILSRRFGLNYRIPK